MPELQCVAVGHQWMRRVTVVSVSINTQESVTFQIMIFLTPKSLPSPLCSPHSREKSIQSFCILDICCFACPASLLVKESLFSEELSVWAGQSSPPRWPQLRRWARPDQQDSSPDLLLEWLLSELSRSPQKVKAWSFWWASQTVWSEPAWECSQ